MDTHSHLTYCKSHGYEPEICAALMRQLNESTPEPRSGFSFYNHVPSGAEAPVKPVLRQVLEQPVDFAIRTSQDIKPARDEARALCARIGFRPHYCTLVATAVSELAHNIVDHAKKGKITLCKIWIDVFPGIFIIAEDSGPGITDARLALKEGYSSSGKLGLGLSGVYRVADIFLLESIPRQGTRICIVFFVPGGDTWHTAAGGRRPSG